MDDYTNNIQMDDRTRIAFHYLTLTRNDALAAARLCALDLMRAQTDPDLAYGLDQAAWASALCFWEVSVFDVRSAVLGQPAGHRCEICDEAPMKSQMWHIAEELERVWRR